MTELKKRLLRAAVVVVLCALPMAVEAQTVVVSNTADSGPGSLREAIQAVNAGTANVIDMTGIVGAVTLASSLPAIVNPVTINGLGVGLTINGGSAGALLLNAGASVTLGGSTLNFFNTEQEVGALAGDGHLVLSDSGLTVGGLGTDAVFNGTITGGDESWVRKEGAGQWTIGGAVTVGSFVLVDGTVALAPDSTFDVEHVAIAGTMALGADLVFGDLGIFPGGTLDLCNNTLTLDGGVFGISLVAGTISGAGGSLHLTGDIGVLLAEGGKGTYTGTTRVSGNAYLGLVGDQILSAASGLLLEDNGTVEIEGINTLASLAGTGGTLVLGERAKVTFDQSIDTTFAGTMSGEGALVKSGGGTLTLAGSSSYTGGTTVLGGTLAGGTESLQGAIVNHARVEFAQSGSGVFNGLISGTGHVAVRGGTVVFAGANTYAGGTSIVGGGTIRLASDASLGAASGALTFDDGTLALDSHLVSARDVRLGGAGTFDTGAHTAMLAGSITGAGSLTKRGTGVMFLTGAASHTGGTSVLEGVLVGATSNLHGTIRNDATVVFDQDAAGTFAGAMNGRGDVVKLGDGMLTIAGAQTYTGLTSVQEGALELGGALAGSVFVAEGAAFGGSGAVAGQVLVAGRFSAGSLLPGAGGGGAGAHAVTAPMRISGDLLLTGGSVYDAHIDEKAASATLAVGGRAVIDGATLHLTAPAGISSSTRRQTSTLLTAAEIVGGFGAITGLADTFDPYLMTIGSSVTLTLVRRHVDFAHFGRTPNGIAVGAALASSQPGATGDLAFVLRELSALASDDDVADALDRLSGAAHASFAGISMIGSADVVDVLTTRLSGRGGWWAQGLGSTLSLGADLDPGTPDVSARGVLAGYDRRYGRAAGLAGGYQDSGVDASGGLDRLDGRAYRGAVYGAYRAGRVVVDAVVSAAAHRVRGARAMRFAAAFDTSSGPGLLFGGVDRTARFAYDATEVAAVADVGYEVRAGGFAIRPSVGAQVTRVSRDGFTEEGADSLVLTAAPEVVSSTAARARLWIERRVDGAARRWIAPRASVRYTRELGARDVPFVASLAGASFTARGFALPQSLFAATAGIGAGVGAVSFSVDYRAAVAAGHRQHLLSAGFGF